MAPRSIGSAAARPPWRASKTQLAAYNGHARGALLAPAKPLVTYPLSLLGLSTAQATRLPREGPWSIGARARRGRVCAPVERSSQRPTAVRHSFTQLSIPAHMLVEGAP